MAPVDVKMSGQVRTPVDSVWLLTALVGAVWKGPPNVPPGSMMPVRSRLIVATVCWTGRAASMLADVLFRKRNAPK